MLSGVDGLLEEARRASARAVNTIMTATYWEIGRRIVEFEQGGEIIARYGEELLVRLSADLSARFGKGFPRQNLQRFRDVNGNLDFVIWSFTVIGNLQAGGEC